jgi:Rapamycin-insensitive companion of mTOR, N-term/Rapamycin-insensitive companion of mTOR, middle domain
LQPQESDLNQSVIHVLKLLRALTKSRSQHSDKHKLLQEINIQMKHLEQSPKHISLLQKDEIIILTRDFLLERGSSTRREASKFLNKLVSGNPLVLERYTHFKVHLFLARNLEKESKGKDPEKTKPIEELKQSLRILKTWIMVSPATFPLILARALCTLMTSPEDRVKMLTLEIIRLLAFANTEVCLHAGGIPILSEACVDPLYEKYSGVLINSILKLMDCAESRDLIKSHIQIPKIFSYFTDIDRTESNNKKEDTDIIEAKLRLASSTILAFFQTWNGIFYLAQEKHSIKSLVEALTQPIKQQARDRILDLLQKILHLAVSLCPPENGYKGCVMRRSLAQLAYFQTILLKEAGLYNILLVSASVDDEEVSQKSQDLLNDFSHLMYSLLPFEEVQRPDFLMNSINLDEQRLDYLRSKCSMIFENMRLKQKLSRPTVSRMKYDLLSRCEHLYLNMPFYFYDSRFNRDVIEKLKLMDYSSMDLKRRAECIKQVASSKSIDEVNFEEVIYVLEMTKTENFQELCDTSFFTDLIKFYLPNQNGFTQLAWTVENMNICKAGYLLIKLLIKSNWGRRFLSIALILNSTTVNSSFVSEYASILENDKQKVRMLLNSNSTPTAEVKVPMSLKAQSVPMISVSNRLSTIPIPNTGTSMHSRDVSGGLGVSTAQQTPTVKLEDSLEFQQFNTTMMREWFSWLGLLTATKETMDLLSDGVTWKLLKDMVHKNGIRDHVLTSVLYSLNYQWTQTRDLLWHCLRFGSPGLAVTCMTIIRLMQRAELPELNSWIKDALLGQLSSRYESVVSAALQTIDVIAPTDQKLSQLLKGSQITPSDK